MTEPCAQGERIVSMETVLKHVSETLVEQKEVSAKTYEVLASISEQSAQIKTLFVRSGKQEKDLEELFGRARTVETEVVKHAGFIANHEKQDVQQSRITGPIIAGLILAIILAIGAFAFNMMDRHNYTQSGQPQGKTK